MKLKALIVCAILGTGICSITTQLLTIREFLTQFHGNEITISLALFCWLLLTGLGSLAAKPVKRSSVALFAALTLLIAYWPLAQMIIIRSFRESVFTHGSSPGFYSIFFYVLFTIAPYCLLTGFVLPYTLKVLHDNQFDFTTGGLYLTDSIGDIAGGLLFSFVFVYWVKPFGTVAYTSTCLILVGLLLLAGARRYVLLSVALILTVLFYSFACNRGFEVATLEAQYGEIVQYVESPYGRIVITSEGPQHTIWESGLPLYSDADVVRSEEKVHYALCQLDRVETVLLVSGGLGETLGEVSKYAPKHIDYVELDPFLTGAALELGVLKEAPSLEIRNTDGRRHIQLTQATYDAIIIDLPDPDTFQINRFFTSEFFSLTKRQLSARGVFSLSMDYSPNYLSEVRKRKLSTLYNTLRLYYRNVLVLPGEDAYFICGDRELTSDIPRRLREKSIETSYIEGFYYGNVTAERIKRIEESLNKEEPVNTDFSPRLINVVFQEWFMKYGTSPRYFALVLFGLTVLYVRYMRKEEYILFSTGLVTMGAEMLVVFAFQVMYGYIYLKIGAIVTAFLLGLLPGALAGKRIRRGDFAKILSSEFVLVFLLGLFFFWVRYSRSELHSFSFLVYCFIFSFFCGFQFPVAASLIGERQSPAAGCLAADLTGAAVGTVVSGTILIPLFGVQTAVAALVLVKVSSIVVLMFHRRKT